MNTPAVKRDRIVSNAPMQWVDGPAALLALFAAPFHRLLFVAKCRSA